MRVRTLLVATLALLGLTWAATPAGLPDYDELKAEAEALYADGSYALAQRLYEEADALELDAFESRWVDFRLADTRWRSAAASGNPDSTELDRAEAALEELATAVGRAEERDRVWAEVQESLADFHWDRQRGSDRGTAWEHYRAALDWWAGSPEIELARARYLGMVWRMARPAWFRDHWNYGYYGNWIEEEILANALAVAREPGDRARVHLLLAESLARSAEPEKRVRVAGEYRAVLELGAETPWYDDALYRLGVWMAEQGEYELSEEGDWSHEADYVEAVALLRRLLEEFEEGETRWYDNASDRVKKLTEPSVALQVSHAFLPDSVLQYSLRWRNAERVELALYPTDLTADVRFEDGDVGNHAWLGTVDVARLEAVHRWSFETGDTGKHVPGHEELVLDEELAPGAYVIEAHARGARSRDLLLVSDASLVVKSVADQVLVWYCDAGDGEPIPGAELLLWERYYRDGDWRWRRHRGTTGEDGTRLFELPERDRYYGGYFAAARIGGRQAFSVGSVPWSAANGDTWRIYAHTDRPTYRALDTVQWKLTARTYDGSVYGTPAGARLAYRINDPQGALFAEAEDLELNAFGSAWGELETTAQMPLGEYRAYFFHQAEDGRVEIGNAVLFRLEEYKLPEFEVAVNTPREDGRPVLYKVGDRVEVDVEASYYFGGPVSEATVEVLVYQKPYHSFWRPRREYSWYFESQAMRWYGWHGPGTLISQSTLETGADGRATLGFDTPEGTSEDYEYTIEARVTDASRREVTGQASVRVTRQAYYVHPQPERRIYAPGDPVTVDFHALDANGNPVSAEGRVRVTRERWREVWIDPAGNRVTGEELEAMKSRLAFFPPLTPPGEPRWELESEGYEGELVEEFSLSTDDEGEGKGRFSVARVAAPGSSARTGSGPARPAAASSATARAASRSSWTGTPSPGASGRR